MATEYAIRYSDHRDGETSTTSYESDGTGLGLPGRADDRRTRRWKTRRGAERYLAAHPATGTGRMRRDATIIEV